MRKWHNAAFLVFFFSHWFWWKRTFLLLKFLSTLGKLMQSLICTQLNLCRPLHVSQLQMCAHCCPSCVTCLWSPRSAWLPVKIIGNASQSFSLRICLWNLQISSKLPLWLKRPTEKPSPMLFLRAPALLVLLCLEYLAWLLCLSHTAVCRDPDGWIRIHYKIGLCGLGGHRLAHTAPPATTIWYFWPSYTASWHGYGDAT